MKKKIITGLFGVFGLSFVGIGKSKAKTVDNVLLTFTKTLEDLKAVEKQEREAIAKHEADLEAAVAAYTSARMVADLSIEAAATEANRAAVAVERFSKLIEGI